MTSFDPAIYACCIDSVHKFSPQTPVACLRCRFKSVVSVPVPSNSLRAFSSKCNQTGGYVVTTPGTGA